ncbi:hypothetical protein [Nocardia aurea]|uniref:hypothetical protein n=1 Tax=Nocardia aurea TaxID=2144174 RepID=UPI0033AEBB51
MMNRFRFEFDLSVPLTNPECNLVLPAIRELMKREGLEPNHGQLTPTDDGRWKMYGSTADLDHDAFIERHGNGRGFEHWQESVEAAVDRIVTEANPRATAFPSWVYSEDDDFWEGSWWLPFPCWDRIQPVSTST